MKFKQLITKLFSLFKRFFLSLSLHCHVEAVVGRGEEQDKETSDDERISSSRKESV